MDGQEILKSNVTNVSYIIKWKNLLITIKIIYISAGCKADSDCVYDKACINSNCLNPCTTHSCGHGAECIVQAHKPHCICPAGTQGSPMVSCVSVVCQYNEDCADHEACDRLNRRCRPVCEQDTCAEQATCLAQSHQPTCTCLSGFQGNPYIECIGNLNLKI